MDTLEKLKDKYMKQEPVMIILEYKCRKCGAVFKLREQTYTIHPPQAIQFHSECYVFSDCTKNYIGAADLQGFEIIEDI